MRGDHLRRGVGLARAGDAEQHLVALVLAHALDQLGDGGGLVALGLVLRHQLEGDAALGLLGPRRPVRHERAAWLPDTSGWVAIIGCSASTCAGALGALVRLGQEGVEATPSWSAKLREGGPVWRRAGRVEGPARARIPLPLAGRGLGVGGATPTFCIPPPSLPRPGAASASGEGTLAGAGRNGALRLGEASGRALGLGRAAGALGRRRRRLAGLAARGARPGVVSGPTGRIWGAGHGGDIWRGGGAGATAAGNAMEPRRPNSALICARIAPGSPGHGLNTNKRRRPCFAKLATAASLPWPGQPRRLRPSPVRHRRRGQGHAREGRRRREGRQGQGAGRLPGRRRPASRTATCTCSAPGPTA